LLIIIVVSFISMLSMSLIFQTIKYLKLKLLSHELIPYGFHSQSLHFVIVYNQSICNPWNSVGNPYGPHHVDSMIIPYHSIGILLSKSLFYQSLYTIPYETSQEV